MPKFATVPQKLQFSSINSSVSCSIKQFYYYIMFVIYIHFGGPWFTYRPKCLLVSTCAVAVAFFHGPGWFKVGRGGSGLVFGEQ